MFNYSTFYLVTTDEILVMTFGHECDQHYVAVIMDHGKNEVFRN